MNVSIRKKLYGGFGIVLLFLVVISISNLVLTSKINTTYTNLVENSTTIVSNIKDLSNDISDEQASVNYFLLTGDSKYLSSYQKAFDNYNEKSKKISELIKGQDSWQILQGLDLIQEQYIIAADQMIDDRRKNNVDKYTKNAAAQGVLIQKFSETAQKFVTNQEEILSKEMDNTKKIVNSSKVIINIITLVTLVLGLWIAYWISDLISKPIKLLSETASKIANGDLTNKEIQLQGKTEDEISELVKSFNKMTNNLKQLLREVGNAATHVASSAQELTAGAEETAKVTHHVADITQNLAAGTEEQVASIEESARAVNTMSQDANKISHRAENVNRQVVKTSEAIQEGNTAVQKAIDQMNYIQNIVANLAVTVQELGDQSNMVNEIIGMITNIASQTNLLALNASIEAARAGEAGRGFSVVASEVSNLAEQTALSGRQVSDVINAILEKTEKTISVVKNGEKAVDDGIKTVYEAGSSFDIIQNSINEVKNTIEEVSRASKSMSGGTEELVMTFEAIEKISRLAADGTQSVSASTEEQLAAMEGVESSAIALTSMSEKLINLIGEFKLSNGDIVEEKPLKNEM